MSEEIMTEEILCQKIDNATTVAQLESLKRLAFRVFDTDTAMGYGSSIEMMISALDLTPIN